MIIDLGIVKYPVFIGTNLLEPFFDEILHSDFCGLVIIDTVVHDLMSKNHKTYQDINPDNIICLEGGKQSKTLYALSNIFSRMEKLNLPRSGKIIAIGGGVIGDIAGLSASLWYRGSELVHVPTTLLSAVDSCVGGKTAVNFNETINAIGTYYHPSRIIIDTNILTHLPQREVVSGLGEVAKYCILGNKELLDIIKSIELDLVLNDDTIEKIIRLCLIQKANYVRGDVFENKKRLFLNLGHTLGHALEINSMVDGVEQLRHGEAIALGIIAISKISLKLGKISNADFQALGGLISRLGLPLSISPSVFRMKRQDLISRCVESAFKDKKRTRDKLRLILPHAYTEGCELYETNSRELLELGLNYVIDEIGGEK